MALVIGTITPGLLDGHPENGTVILLPPQNGQFGWSTVFLSFGCDWADAKLRVAIYNDKGGWRVSEVQLRSAGPRVSVIIQDGDSKVSVGRLKTSPTDLGMCPVGFMIETSLKP